MKRVCLDCGTPKLPLKEKCIPCGKVTLTHEGEARQSICHRCRHVKRFTDGTVMCGWTGSNKPKAVKRNLMIDRALDLGVDYAYACGDFQARYNDPGASPNPLSFQEREEIRQFIEMPWAFWLDPRRWDGIEDTHKQMFWDKPVKTDFKPAIAVGAMALVASLFLMRKTG